MVVSGQRLAVGIIGDTRRGGYGHQLHLGFAACADVAVLAIADEDADGLAATADLLGVQARYPVYTDLLARTDLDAVLVAPRDVRRHEEYVLAALDRGLHVYCEKPLAQDLAQADRMVSAASARGLVLANALPGGHEPRFVDVLDRVRRGDIGDVVAVHGLCKWDHRGGGEDALVLGLHFADLARRLLGDARAVYGNVSTRGRRITAADAYQGKEGVGLVAGDSFFAAITHESGVVSTLESYRCGIEDRSVHPYRLEIVGTSGAIWHRAPYADGSTWIAATSAPAPDHTGWQRIAGETVPYASHHTRGARDFVAAIRTGTAPACSGQDGLAALEIIHAAYVSNAIGAEVALPLAQRDHPLAK